MKFTSIIALAWVSMTIAGCATAQHSAELALPDGALQITELHMLDAHHGWAWSGGLAGQQLLLRTSDGGTTWRDVTPREFPHSEEGTCFFDACTAWVSFFNRTNITAGLLRTTDGGNSWSLLNQTNTPIFNEASSCRFFSSTYGIGTTSDGGLGSSYTTFYETHDAGKTWNRIPFTPRSPDLSESPNTFHLSNIGGDRITFYPPGSVVIAYGDTADEKPKGVVRLSLTTDLGKTWHDLDLPLLKQFHDFLCVPLEPRFMDKKNIVLAAHVFESITNGSYSNGALVFYVSNDGGATWTVKQGIITLQQPWYGDGFDLVSSRCFFVANGSHFCVTHDGAQSWETITPNISFGGNSKCDIVGMDFIDATHGWMIVSDKNQFHADGNFILYHTVDGAKTWTQLPVRVTR